MNQQKKSLWIDFRQLKETITLHQVIEHYSIQLTQKADGSLIGICPLHEGADNPTAFRISADGRAWHCFTRCTEPQGGNVLDFVMRKEKVGLRQAGVMLSEWFLVNNNHERNEAEAVAPQMQDTEPKARPVNKPLDFDLSKRLKKDVPFLTEQKQLTAKTIEKFGVGYCARGMHAGRIVIPVHDEQGRVVAYAGRTLKATEAKQGRKYWFPANFHKNAELFNLHRVIAIPKLVAKRGIILVEGFFDAIQLWQNGIYNSVAIMGTSLSQWQEEMLFQHTDKLTLLLDNNKAGKQGTEQITKQLISKCFLRIPEYPDNCFQPEELTKEQLKEMLYE